LHPDIVRVLPPMLSRVERRTGRQIFISTHSPDLLRDEGIGLDEVLLLRPGAEGTEVSLAVVHNEIQSLLDGGLSMADVVIPRTRPPQPGQLLMFGDS
jgi:hypothetical protein